MTTDLRDVNKVIQLMGSLQLGIPLPSSLPSGWPIIVIDVKDCFFIFFSIHSVTLILNLL